MAETMIGSEIVRLGNEINERIRKGEKIFNFVVNSIKSWFDRAISIIENTKISYSFFRFSRSNSLIIIIKYFSYLYLRGFRFRLDI